MSPQIENVKKNQMKKSRTKKYDWKKKTVWAPCRMERTKESVNLKTEQ